MPGHAAVEVGAAVGVVITTIVDTTLKPASKKRIGQPCTLAVADESLALATISMRAGRFPLA